MSGEWTAGMRAAQRGMTMLELMIVVPLLAILLGLSFVGVTRFMSQRTLLGWTDVVVNDMRAAQQLGVSRRATVVVTFTAKAGNNPASYNATVGGATVRSQSLPSELNLTAQTVQFSSLGVPSTGSAVTVQLSDSVIGQSRTITVAPVTGSVKAQ
jgi:prepilin-type N-terminal cleavage/methylation domain-containing protein